jgi:hypothetical protein
MMQQADVVRHLQLVPWLVPAGAIEHRVVTIGDVPADFAQMPVHGVDVDPGQDQGGADALGGADSPKQAGPFVAEIARPGAALGPDIGHGSLLTDAGLILPPHLDRPVPGRLGHGPGYQSGEVFFMRLKGLYVLLRMLWSDRHVPESQTLEQRADAALGQHDAEPPLPVSWPDARREILAAPPPSSARSRPARTQAATSASCSAVSFGMPPGGLRSDKPRSPSAL